MEVDAHVWVRTDDPNLVWEKATIVAKDAEPRPLTQNHELDALDQSNEIFVVTVENERTGKSWSIRLDEDGQAIIKLRNTATSQVVDDLTNLPHLHEPAILNSLEVRYSQGYIYTNTGPTLIAVNPFKQLEIYGEEQLQAYKEYGHLLTQGHFSATLPPHLYSVADCAYREMMRAIGRLDRELIADQCILIGGESGAGKTESTKYVMKYLTRVHEKGSASVDQAQNTLMRRLIESNPILEAFGNAKTIRNNNSSRFGKYIETYFNSRGELVGAAMQAYLLEKVRVVSHAAHEGTFHIFYQILAGSNTEERIRWNLQDPSSFKFLHNDSRISDQAGTQSFLQTKNAMEILGFANPDIDQLLSCVAGLLHLVNVQFMDGGSQGGVQVDISENDSISTASRLIGLRSQDLTKCLTVRVLETGREVVETPCSLTQASYARNAMAKALYGRLFDWIMQEVNASVRGDTNDIRATIGVLDIFGFECFQINSFEQLCINYTNETLQQQFNDFVFKAEQIEYEKEKIDFRFIDYPDNTPCLMLIEEKNLGILEILHDECFVPQPSDEKFAARLYREHSSHPYFSATKVQKSKNAFGIKHYAGLVEYTSLYFLEKNRDFLPKETSALFASSNLSLVSSIFPVSEISGPATGRGKGRGKTVAIQFKEALRVLLTKIKSTKPHYVRCIKPNDMNAPGIYSRARVCEQLRCGGVLEAVRVARSGFPVRWSHEYFYMRYRPVLTSEELSKCKLDPSQLPRYLLRGSPEVWERCVRLISAIVHVSRQSAKEIRADELQLGETKVFLRNHAYDALEAWIARRCSVAARSIQAAFRGYQARVSYRKYIAARKIQKVVRGCLCRKFIRKLASAIKIQSHFRRYSASRRFLTLKSAIRAFQGAVQDEKATLIQLWWRRRVAFMNAIRRLEAKQQLLSNPLLPVSPPVMDVPSSIDQVSMVYPDDSQRFEVQKPSDVSWRDEGSYVQDFFRTQHSLFISQCQLVQPNASVWGFNTDELKEVEGDETEDPITCTAIMDRLLHTSDSSIQDLAKVCRSLSLVTADSMSHRTILGGLGACPALVKLLDAYQDQHVLVLQGVWAMRNLAYKNAVNRRSFGDAGACELLVRIISMYREDVDISDTACKALFTICLDQDSNIVRTRSTPIFHVLTRLLIAQIDSQPGVCKQACRCIGVLMRGQVSAESEAQLQCSPKLAEKIAAVMEKYADDHRLMADCCWAIRHIALASKHNIEALREAQMCAKVTQVMNAHKRKRVVVEECMCVLNLLLLFDQNAAPHAARFSVLAVLEVLRQHAQNCLIVEQAMACVRHALQFNFSKVVDLRSAMSDAVTIATLNHTSNPRTATACVLTIGHMCARPSSHQPDTAAVDSGSEEIRKDMRACGAAVALSKVLKEHLNACGLSDVVVVDISEHKNVCAYSLWAMRRFAYNLKENKKALVKEGIPKIVVLVMKRFCGLDVFESVLEQAAAVTLEMMNGGGNDTRSTFVDEGIVDVLVQLMSNHSSSFVISECAIKALATLVPKRKFTLRKGTSTRAKGLLRASGDAVYIIRTCMQLHVNPSWQPEAEAVVRCLTERQP